MTFNPSWDFATLIKTPSTDTIVIGDDTTAPSITGANNIIFGNGAGASISTGTDSTLIGNLAGQSATGNRNVAIGSSALGDATGGAMEDNVAIGYVAGDNITTGSDNVLIGAFSGRNVTSDQGNVAIGYQTLNTGGGTPRFNVAIGWQAGRALPGDFNIAIGYQAMEDGPGGDRNIAIGERTFKSGTGSFNTFIGSDAGQTGTHSNSVFMGYQAGQIWSGSNNTLVGQFAGSSTLTGSGDRDGNVGIGTNVLFRAESGANDNVAIGSEALPYLSTGVRNIAIGYYAGREATLQGLTTGSDNILIGYQVNIPLGSPNVDGEIRIGNRNLTSVDPIFIEMEGEAADLHLYHYNGTLEINQFTAGSPTGPSITTDKLYNVGGDLYWSGTQITSGGAVGSLAGLSDVDLIGSPEAPIDGDVLTYNGTTGTWQALAGPSFPLLAPDGSAGAPSYSFSSDTNTGIYRRGTDELGFATAGTLRAHFTNNFVLDNSAVILASDGSASVPGYTFGTDTDTGIYRSSDNTLAVSTGGTVALAIGNAQQTNFLDNHVQRAILFDYGEVVNTDTGGGSPNTIDLDIEVANVHDITLTGNATFTFSNPKASGTATTMTLILRQDATGGRTVTWPASVDWPGGTAPTISSAANAVDVYTFITTDGGTTWLGMTGGQAFA